MTVPFAKCSLPDLAHEIFLATRAETASALDASAAALLLPCFTNKEHTEAVLQRHPHVQGASGLVCSGSEQSELAWSNMLADLFDSAGVAVSSAVRLCVYFVCRECARRASVRLCAFIADLLVHPARPLSRPALVAELEAHPAYRLASQISAERWQALLCRRVPSQALAQQWHVTGIGIGLQQRQTLLCRGALCAALVLRLMCFQGQFCLMHPSNAAKHIVSRRHFLGPSRNLGESLFHEGQRLHGEQRYSDAAQLWAQAALLRHGPAHAHTSLMLFYGRPDFRKDEKLAFEFASAGAALGCVHSKGALGDCYIDGAGVAEDIAKGFALARESEAAGSCFGQAVVGGCFNHGIHVRQDYAEAARLYRLAAAQGHAVAQCNLGMFFFSGRGVGKQDYAEAVLLWRLAADQGDAEARKNLGCMFRDGRGVAQDHEEAFRHFRIAAAQGNARAIAFLNQA